MSADSQRPIRASKHCRHYSYERGTNGGPRCAVGVDNSSATGPCMPEPRGECPQRVNYTEAERAAWEAEVDASLNRLGAAVTALPKAIPERSSGKVTCPNCSKPLHYERWRGGASIQCETKDCVGPTRFNIRAGAKWPQA